jgi:uncharacterized protein YlbG (UPF0298 family)
MKLLVLTLFFFFSGTLQATMYGNMGDLDKELENLNEFKTMKGKNKCQIICYISWNKSVQQEDQRFSNVRYHTRSQTKKHKKISHQLVQERGLCLKKCK